MRHAHQHFHANEHTRHTSRIFPTARTPSMARRRSATNCILMLRPTTAAAASRITFCATKLPRTMPVCIEIVREWSGLCTPHQIQAHASGRRSGTRRWLQNGCWDTVWIVCACLQCYAYDDDRDSHRFTDFSWIIYVWVWPQSLSSEASDWANVLPRLWCRYRI